jgi:hypothetical protein
MSSVTALTSEAKVQEGFNEDESQVKPYTLPAVLSAKDGSRITTAEQWTQQRRPEIMALLTKEMFGAAPPLPDASKIKATITSPPTPAFGGLALRQQVTLTWTDGPDAPFIDILLYLPREAKGPVPLFWGLNFEGNHSVEADPAIPLSRSMLMDEIQRPERYKKASVASNRGGQHTRYPLEIPLKAGFAVATACYYDIDPDFDDNFANGVHRLYPETRNNESWGSIAAWAWGMRIGLEYFLTQSTIDGKKVIAMGHSRLGKTALWAGATEPRFALVISNDSGCGGAALSKRNFGETVARINSVFPHWFCKNFRRYDDQEANLPWDQHFLIAAIAPRPVLVTSATDDAWADPKGEFLSAFHANPVFELFGKKGTETDVWPAPDKLIGSSVGYHLRTGPHDVTSADWNSYVTFSKSALAH